MSWNPGDFNNDGRVDYVDQKIFDTQINPYSGEYQGPSSGSSGFDATIIIYGILAVAALFVIGFIDEHVGFFAQFLPAVAMMFFVPWKKLRQTDLPFSAPFTTLIPLAGAAVLLWMVITAYRRIANGDYYSSGFFTYYAVRTYLSPLLGVILTFIACRKNKYKLLLIGVLFIGATAAMLLVNIILNSSAYSSRGIFIGILSFATYVLTLVCLMLPKKRTLCIVTLICAAIWLLLTRNPISVFLALTALAVFMNKPQEQKSV